MRVIKYWIIPAVLVVALIVIAKGGFWSKGGGQQVSAAPVSVTVSDAHYVGKIPQLMLTGSIEGETSAVISSKIAGRVEEVAVEDGQRVNAGQQLVRLESLELANAVRMARDAAARGQANYDNVAADYTRYQTLYQQNAVSRQMLDGVEMRLKLAKADLSSAYANLSNAEQQYAYAVVSAPVGGVVANKAVTVGQVVAAGMTLMKVEDINKVYAVANIEQKDMGLITAGLPAEITVDAFPGQIFKGKVEIINPAAGTSSRMFRIKIKIENPEGRLKPGIFVKVRVVTGSAYQVLAVPQSAVFQKNGLYYIYSFENGIAVKRQVEPGEIVGDNLEIKSGVQEKTQVITGNVSKIKDGDAIAVVK